MTETDVEVVCEQIRAEKPDIVMIDSIQTMNLTELSSSPGQCNAGQRIDKLPYAHGKIA